MLAPAYAAALCRGDLDGNSRVNVEDAYLWERSPADIDGDALVDASDRRALLRLARDEERAESQNPGVR